MGVRKFIMKRGYGFPLVSNLSKKIMVQIHYTGHLENGKVFDTTKIKCKPFECILFNKSMIPGLDIGISTMSVGEKSLIACQPQYAFGKKVVGVIPQNSTVVFEVELIDWKEVIDKKTIPCQKSIYSLYNFMFMATMMYIILILNTSGYVPIFASKVL
jgi:hypothetical protein